MKIVVLDPGSYTAHYDANLCRALAARGHTVKLDTSAFLFEDVPPLGGYEVRHAFFRAVERLPQLESHARARRAVKAGLYPIEMLRWATRVARRPPDVAHVQWSLLPVWDATLTSALRRRGTRVVLTVHDVEP